MKINKNLNTQNIIDSLHYIRPSFNVSLTQLEEFLLVQPLLKKSTRVLIFLSQLAATMIDSFEHVD